jgi:hypothetical protein
MMLSDKQQAVSASELADAGLPTDLVQWLAKLRLLYGLPFNYLVPKNEFLPAETIRFFHLDPDWIASLVDGALSIGRHYNGPDAPPATIHSDLAQHELLHTQPVEFVHNVRRQQLSLDVAPLAPLAAANEPKAMSGFLLNSTAVSAWKSIDVAGYAKGSSPYDYEKNSGVTVQSLPIARLERLSSTVLLGIFQGSLYELVLHQPPEAIHFGFQQISVENAPNTVTKTLRVPKTNWDDPATSYDTDTYQDKPLGSAFVDAGERVLDMTQLSRALAAQLAAVGPSGAPGYYQAKPADDNHKDHLVASDFALEMVQGVGLVSFINE